MGVSFSEKGLVAAEQRGARARTRKLMLETATALMQEGVTPSVSDVAEAAEVSRATAYRYFPSQAALVTAVVDEGLGPILRWQSDSADAEERVADLLNLSMPRIVEFESTFKAALKLSLEQWARRQAGTLGEEPPFQRGHRVALLQSAIAPLRKTLPRKQFQRLAKALSLVYGLEVLIVLRDLWGLEFEETRSVALWAAQALVRAAVSEAEAARASGKQTGKPTVRRKA
jgi:AcrR family transcriptional regulator